MTVRAVTFDFWNTLVRETPGSLREVRRARWLDVLGEAGVAVDGSVIDAAFDVVWGQHHAAWKRNEQYTPQTAARVAIGLLGVDLPDRVRTELEEAFCSAGEAASLELCPGVADAVDDLATRGVRLGIICDVGFTPSPALRRLLERWRMLSAFTGWSFSDEVGHYKPARAIFEHALAYLGSPPSETAHIGDLRRTDVAGARAAGWLSLRYRGVNDDTEDLPDADIVIDDHAHLVAALDA